MQTKDCWICDRHFREPAWGREKAPVMDVALLKSTRPNGTRSQRSGAGQILTLR